MVGMKRGLAYAFVSIIKVLYSHGIIIKPSDNEYNSATMSKAIYNIIGLWGQLTILKSRSKETLIE
ncbi:hypothetical protein P152DRAFT_87641 [Eremomyces bilateralis CBS 781.70]|uniref:Uncharacterized protein n=1 Tax=Eremomyces bilateralis CBS 781.70 TaxID=1392243 RepID=A0A6G1FYZ8_9PEZI|nr:uncharacterized protein P152DRAFT_87641 [Eremomyces bilateralis CBS 781.70]KAF1810910.1 hypothetical protein P152DRAFT_87641 [Eremomyces bilateralis CBS 781.70]